MLVVPHRPEVELASRALFTDFEFFAVFEFFTVFDGSVFADAFLLDEFVAVVFEVRLAEEEPKTEELPNVSF